MFGWFKKDLELDRVVSKLSEQLEKVDDWRPYESIQVKHRLYNIIISKRRISAPDEAWIPFRWKRTINRQINAIYRKAEVNKFHFIYDVIDGKYPYFINTYDINDKIRDWLKENATKDQYMIIGRHSRRAGLYFIDAELAMGYKLTFEN